MHRPGLLWPQLTKRVRQGEPGPVSFFWEERGRDAFSQLRAPRLGDLQAWDTGTRHGRPLPSLAQPRQRGPPRADAGGSREVSMMWLTCSRIHIDEGARSVHGSGSQGPGLGCTVQGGAPASVSRETRGGALGSGGGTKKPWLGRCREPTLAWLFRPGPWTLPRRLQGSPQSRVGLQGQGTPEDRGTSCKTIHSPLPRFPEQELGKMAQGLPARGPPGGLPSWRAVALAPRNSG